MDQMEVIRIVNRKMKPKEQIIKSKDERVTRNTPKAISSGKEKSSRKKMREMLNKRRTKKLTKSVPIDQQLIALNREEMELKREILRKMDHQEEQFNQTLKILEEITTRFTDIVSGTLQMMDVAFQQQGNNVMDPPGNNYQSNDAGFSQWTRQQNNEADLSQWTRQQNYQRAEWDGQERDVEKHTT